MYRGAELQDAVDQNFSFLDNVSAAGTMSRGTRQEAGSVQVGTWDDRQRPARTQAKYWQPRYKSLRDMPGYVQEKSLPRSMDWHQRRIQEERIAMVRQQEWEREKLRREEERKSADRREMERQREDQWRQAEKAKEFERQRQLEEEYRFREEERQRAAEREQEEERRERERLNERARILEADRIRRQRDEETVRRWKVHPAQIVEPSERTEDDKERVRHWDVHPSASDDRLKHWKEELKQKKLQESLKSPPIGNYIEPPRAPNDAHNSQVPRKPDSFSTNGKDGSSLLKRTNNYLDAIDRMHSQPSPNQNNQDKRDSHVAKDSSVVPPSNVPKPPSMSGFETFKLSKNGKVDERFIAERIKDLKNVDVPVPPPIPPTQHAPYQDTTPNLQAVQSARSALRPIDKRTIEDKTYEPEPKTFKEKLDRLLAFQLATQRHMTKPVTAEPVVPESSDRYQTVKPLTKLAMKDKLEEILVQGPSFRGGAEMEEKREAVASRYRENQRVADEVKVVRRTASTNRRSILPQENGVRGDGAHRWRHSDVPHQAR